jgi:hypothetical protein
MAALPIELELRQRGRQFGEDAPGDLLNVFAARPLLRRWLRQGS